jgi:hypothetical protein
VLINRCRSPLVERTHIICVKSIVHTLHRENIGCETVTWLLNERGLCERDVKSTGGGHRLSSALSSTAKTNAGQTAARRSAARA